MCSVSQKNALTKACFSNKTKLFISIHIYTSKRCSQKMHRSSSSLTLLATVGAGISVLGYERAQAEMSNDVCTVACGHIVIYLFLCLSESFLCSVKDFSLHCHQFVSSCEKARELDLMGIAENTELAVFLQIPGRTDSANGQGGQT